MTWFLEDLPFVASIGLNVAVLGVWLYRRIRRGLFLLYVESVRTSNDPLVTPRPEMPDGIV